MLREPDGISRNAAEPAASGSPFGTSELGDREMADGRMRPDRASLLILLHVTFRLANVLDIRVAQAQSARRSLTNDEHSWQ